MMADQLQVGADRVPFATDHPFERATEAAAWVESAPISDADRRPYAGFFVGTAAAVPGR